MRPEQHPAYGRLDTAIKMMAVRYGDAEVRRNRRSADRRLKALFRLVDALDRRGRT